MHHAIRQQNDERQEEYSRLTALDASSRVGNVDKARQEDLPGTDINAMFKRFGGFGQVRTDPQFGEIDYDLNLQTALAAVDQARSAWRRQPQSIKELYPTWQQLLLAVEDGEIRVKDGKLELTEAPKPPRPETGSQEPPGGSKT